ncbi:MULTISPECIES: ATP-binding protein [Kitasatospora]|uniref:histidine kinase n=1 Tax=Kitasatospora setae (strain ATCC 33774 / DSM 43861 / JCM 3304 / KCC A-0304 / NBRC 14216 / KM-6054) TaxID=452652 RepID=E4N0N7_KITSK|nr:ATP-binding protein [Kitasatospora setae]BAJ31721.1 putative two-component system sensor kinase [Kitasatospora setae KM-6054]
MQSEQAGRDGRAERPERLRRLRRVCCGLLAAGLVFLALLAPPGARAGALLVAGLAGLAVTAAALRRPWRRCGPAGPAGLVALLSLAVDAGYFGPRGLVLLWLPFEYAALLVLAGRTVRRSAARRAAFAAAAVVLAALALPLRFTVRLPQAVLGTSVVAAAAAALPVAVAIGTGLHLRRQDERQARAVRLARREQRLEVARDLHDFVAHEVTGILLEVQAAQFSGYDERQTGELLARLEAAGTRALDSMDHTLRTLRERETPGAGPGLAELPALVDRFRAAGPADTVLTLTTPEPGTADTVPPETGDTAYRVVLEALTNIRRHAARAGHLHVEVTRTGDPAVLRVTVTDSGGRDPAATPPRRPGEGGTGLAALAARVHALGGTLTAGPHTATATPGRPGASGAGWRVRAELPLHDGP